MNTQKTVDTMGYWILYILIIFFSFIIGFIPAGIIGGLLVDSSIYFQVGTIETRGFNFQPNTRAYIAEGLLWVIFSFVICRYGLKVLARSPSFSNAQKGKALTKVKKTRKVRN